MFTHLCRTSRTGVIAIAVLLLSFAAPASVFAGVGIDVKNAWSPATAPNAPAATAYMVLHNKTDRADQLVSAESASAQSVTLHSMSMEGGMMSMHMVKSITVPAHGMTALKSDGFHLMLKGLKKSFKEGAMIELTLKFKNAGEVKVHLPVKKEGQEGHGTGKKMDMGGMKH